MRNNPIQFLVKSYNDQVKKTDAEGYAKAFKKCTEVFFQSVNEDQSGPSDLRFHFTDIQYLDGYFIFGFGTNSVVHFHITECPGWLFGIWWNAPDKEDKSKNISGTLFAQYEETLNKFKPSRSEFRESITVSKGEDGKYSECFTWLARNMFEFIHNEPHLAFCKDYCYWDYNREYHTREEAVAKFNEYCESRDNEKKYTEICNNRVLDFVRENILPCFNEATIEDLGDNTSPRFEIRAPLKKNKHLVDKRGVYSLFADDDKDGQALLDRFDAIVKECQELAEAHDVWWIKPFNYCILFYK